MSKPFLKWAGGKFKLAPFIQSHLPSPKRKRLIEPFAGSASLSLALDFDSYLLNDTNSDLINLYRMLKQEKQGFVDYARSFFSPKNNQEHLFYDLREQFNHSDDIAGRSALFIYLNRHAFNGLCRYNSKGDFNVPFGRYKSPYFPELEMRGFIAKSDRIELMCGDFQTTLALATDDDTVYCDPPYVPLSNTASFTAYAKDRFDLSYQNRLAVQAKEVAEQSQGVLISNHDTEFTRQIYQGARIETIDVQRNIAAKGSSRQKVGDLWRVNLIFYVK
ncbi:Dam family site-specific DNA-(adenine-N6)-methyltransferase [Neisseria iguanae]|uniref:Site-specific DNA-methyltransferase (adenine-specific) n=1 Tax=Neisseria iguanae TaxID=90242 RepID=A0A2P7U2G7_9NEIS|nr:Dam family site-specific DNA-(adenine-N6)-methyltransferase [Neisseria iguanae]PSJ81135.1 DNA adenine methylase [Neisseria iguanae]